MHFPQIGVQTGFHAVRGGNRLRPDLHPREVTGQYGVDAQVGERAYLRVDLGTAEVRKPHVGLPIDQHRVLGLAVAQHVERQRRLHGISRSCSSGRP